MRIHKYILHVLMDWMVHLSTYKVYHDNALLVKRTAYLGSLLAEKVC